jgi:hypothetical protein
LRMEAYPCYRQSIYPAGGAATGKPLTIEGNNQAIVVGRERLKKTSD